jgi:hypothetical protein
MTQNISTQSFSSCITQVIKGNRQDFLDGFVGFFEGDEGFCISRCKPPRRYEFSLSIPQKDREIIVKYMYFALENVISLLNGRFKFQHRTHDFSCEMHVFHTEWVGQFDQRYGTSHTKPLRPSTDVTLNTAWLSGFMQAEGHFTRQELYRQSSFRAPSIILRIGWT